MYFNPENDWFIIKSDLIACVCQLVRWKLRTHFKDQQLENKLFYLVVIYIGLFLATIWHQICNKGTQNWQRFTMICPKTCDFKSCTTYEWIEWSTITFFSNKLSWISAILRSLVTNLCQVEAKTFLQSPIWITTG